METTFTITNTIILETLRAVETKNLVFKSCRLGSLFATKWSLRDIRTYKQTLKTFALLGQLPTYLPFKFYVFLYVFSCLTFLFSVFSVWSFFLSVCLSVYFFVILHPPPLRFRSSFLSPKRSKKMTKKGFDELTLLFEQKKVKECFGKQFGI
jgi:hypothetical protein